MIDKDGIIVEGENKNLMDYSQFFIKFDKNADTTNLTNAYAFIQSEVKILKDKISKIDETLNEYYNEIGPETAKK